MIADIIRKVVYHFSDERLFDEAFEKQFKDYYNLTDEEFDSIFIRG